MIIITVLNMPIYEQSVNVKKMSPVPYRTL